MKNSKEFPNEPYQQLFKRADALGFEIEHIKKMPSSSWFHLLEVLR